MSRLTASRLARDYGIAWIVAERLLREHTRRHWRRFGWLGLLAGGALACFLADAFFPHHLPEVVRATLLPFACLASGLQLWLAQRAARPDILREAARLGEGGHRPPA